MIAHSDQRGGVIVAAGDNTRVSHAVVRNNVIVDSATEAMRVTNWGLGIDDVRFLGNSIAGTQGTGISLQFTGISDVSIVDDILAGIAAGQPHVAATDPVPGLVIDHDLIWPGPLVLDGVAATNAVVGDPRFVAVAANDLRLGARSAAIDAGTTRSDLPFDLLGAARPAGVATDIGAYESGGTTSVAMPAITNQPSDRTASVGASVTFTVSASGTAPLAYQWQKNGLDLAGATGASYTIPSAAVADDGATFRVVVSNPAGNATSRQATLTVLSGNTTGAASGTSAAGGRHRGCGAGGGYASAAAVVLLLLRRFTTR